MRWGRSFPWTGANSVSSTAKGGVNFRLFMVSVTLCFMFIGQILAFFRVLGSNILTKPRRGVLSFGTFLMHTENNGMSKKTFRAKMVICEN